MSSDSSSLKNIDEFVKNHSIEVTYCVREYYHAGSCTRPINIQQNFSLITEYFPITIDDVLSFDPYGNYDLDKRGKFEKANTPCDRTHPSETKPCMYGTHYSIQKIVMVKNVMNVIQEDVAKHKGFTCYEDYKKALKMGMTTSDKYYAHLHKQKTRRSDQIQRAMLNSRIKGMVEDLKHMNSKRK